MVLVLVTTFDAQMWIGDPIDRSRVATAGAIFDERGLFAERLAPSFYGRIEPVTALSRYIHLPSLPYYWSWIIALTGVAEWAVLVMSNLVFAIVTVGIWIYVAQRWGGEVFAWMVAAGLMMAVPTYSSLPYDPLSIADLLLAMFVLTVVMYAIRISSPTEYESNVVRISGTLGAIAAVALVATLAGFEYVPTMLILAFVIPILWSFRRPSDVAADGVWSARVRRGVNPALAAGSGISLALSLHFLRNLWVLGSVQAVVDDYRNAADFRTTGGRFLQEVGGIGDFGLWLNRQIDATFRVNWRIVLLVVGLAVIVGLRQRASPLLSIAGLSVVAWIAFGVFPTVFRQWTLVHWGAKASRQFIVPFAFTIGLASLSLWLLVRSRRSWRSRLTVTLPAIVLVWLLSGVVTGNVSAVATLVADMPRSNSMSAELDDLRGLLSLVSDLGGERVATPDSALITVALLHQPRKYFDLPTIPVDRIEPGAVPPFVDTSGVPDGCRVDQCVLVVVEAGALDLTDRCREWECVVYGGWMVIYPPTWR